MNVFKIQSEIEKLVTELKKIAKENEVNIYVEASPYELIIDTVRIFEAKDIRSSPTIDVIYEKTNKEINTVFKYITLSQKKETAYSRNNHPHCITDAMGRQGGLAHESR